MIKIKIKDDVKPKDSLQKKRIFQMIERQINLLNSSKIKGENLKKEVKQV